MPGGKLDSGSTSRAGSEIEVIDSRIVAGDGADGEPGARGGGRSGGRWDGLDAREPTRARSMPCLQRREVTTECDDGTLGQRPRRPRSAPMRASAQVMGSRCPTRTRPAPVPGASVSREVWRAATASAASTVPLVCRVEGRGCPGVVGWVRYSGQGTGRDARAPGSGGRWWRWRGGGPWPAVPGRSGVRSAARAVPAVVAASREQVVSPGARALGIATGGPKVNIRGIDARDGPRRPGWGGRGGAAGR